MLFNLISLRTLDLFKRPLDIGIFMPPLTQNSICSNINVLNPTESRLSSCIPLIHPVFSLITSSPTFQILKPEVNPLHLPFSYILLYKLSPVLFFFQVTVFPLAAFSSFYLYHYLIETFSIYLLEYCNSHLLPFPVLVSAL